MAAAGSQFAWIVQDWYVKEDLAEIMQKIILRGFVVNIALFMGELKGFYYPIMEPIVIANVHS